MYAIIIIMYWWLESNSELFELALSCEMQILIYTVQKNKINSVDGKLGQMLNILLCEQWWMKKKKKTKMIDTTNGVIEPVPKV